MCRCQWQQRRAKASAWRGPVAGVARISPALPTSGVRWRELRRRGLSSHARGPECRPLFKLALFQLGNPVDAGFDEQDNFVSSRGDHIRDFNVVAALTVHGVPHTLNLVVQFILNFGLLQGFFAFNKR